MGPPYQVVLLWPQQEFFVLVAECMTWCQSHMTADFKCKPGVRFYETQTQACVWEFHNQSDAIWFSITWSDSHA